MPVSILAVVSEADLPLPLLGLAHLATHQGTAAPEATQHLGRKWETKWGLPASQIPFL